jgi:uncharacterized protein YcfJ
MQLLLRRIPRFLAVLFFALTCPRAESQIFSSEAVQGSLLGGVIGGFIGHNSNRREAEGIGIGAGAGFLAGTLAGERRHYDTYIPSRSRSRYADAPSGTRGPRPALAGAALGAMAGGIVGHNSGGNTMEGVGIGATGGLLLGAAAEQFQRRSANQHHFAEPAHPGHSLVFHSNPPTARPSAFPETIMTREVGESTIVTSSMPSLDTGSTLSVRIPDHTTVSTPIKTAARQIRFEYLGSVRNKKGAEQVRASE